MKTFTMIRKAIIIIERVVSGKWRIRDAVYVTATTAKQVLATDVYVARVI